MLTFQEMIIRFIVAIALGAILGIERELVRKEAGVRTEMVVAAGAAIFAMVGIALPGIISEAYNVTIDATSAIGAFNVIAGVVTGIGFLGAGLIIKMNEHPHGVTTAALVWTTAAIGVLAGIGLTMFAVAATVIIAFVLYILRKLNVSERIEGRPGEIRS